MFLVTGGTGFIGKRVVAQLLSKNIQVIATDINTDNEKDSFEKYLSTKGGYLYHRFRPLKDCPVVAFQTLSNLVL